MLKLGSMHRLTGETFVVLTTMSRQMKEVLDFWSFQPLTTWHRQTPLSLTNHPEDGHGNHPEDRQETAQIGNTTRLITCL